MYALFLAVTLGQQPTIIILQHGVPPPQVFEARSPYSVYGGGCQGSYSVPIFNGSNPGYFQGGQMSFRSQQFFPFRQRSFQFSGPFGAGLQFGSQFGSQPMTSGYCPTCP